MYVNSGWREKSPLLIRRGESYELGLINLIKYTERSYASKYLACKAEVLFPGRTLGTRTAEGTMAQVVILHILLGAFSTLLGSFSSSLSAQNI